MPDVDGKLYFPEFKAELAALGFDGFSDAQLGTFVNRGYFAVAKKSRWEWEETTDTFTIAPGSANVDLWPTVSGELPNFRSLDKLYCTTTGHTLKLAVMNRDVFFQEWLSKDLTLVQTRAEPTHYFVYQGKLYVLSPPDQSRTYLAYYHRRVSRMTGDLETALTPVHLDEAIIDAARIRAHRASNETGLAQLAREDLEEQFDDMRDDEEEGMDEEPTRVTPDNSWA